MIPVAMSLVLYPHFIVINSVYGNRAIWPKFKLRPDSQYPVVADLSGTHFAVLDLEPARTTEEEMVYESIMGYYEEETMRGGRHKLVIEVKQHIEFTV